MTPWARACGPDDQRLRVSPCSNSCRKSFAADARPSPDDYSTPHSGPHMTNKSVSGSTQTRMREIKESGERLGANASRLVEAEWPTLIARFAFAMESVLLNRSDRVRPPGSALARAVREVHRRHSVTRAEGARKTSSNNGAMAR